MVARINTVAFQGIDVQPVDVQVQISNGLPAFTIVGLPDKAVAVSKLSARGYFRILRVARTIADLQEAINGQVYEKIDKIHIAEALGYRRASLS